MTDHLQEMLDRDAIAAAVRRYCRGVDRLDTEMIVSAYHPDGYDDHGELKGGVEEFVAELVPLLRRKYLSTSHNITNQIIEFDDADPDKALSESYLIAVHLTESEGAEWQEIVFGRYIDRFERRGRDWRIVHRVVVMDSRNTQKVNPSRLATDEAQLLRGRHFPDDEVYHQRAVLASASVATSGSNA